MKYLSLLVSVICSINCYSQDPNPELFQTWYLSELIGDFSPSFNVLEIVPAVSPTLTISNNLNFSGEGACNAFNGSFTYVTSDIFETALFFPTLSICNAQIHSSFELSYFNFLQSTLQYQIIPQEQGLILVLNHPLMAQAIFQNFALKTKDFDSDQITIYPNPTNANLFLNFKSLVVSEIQVMNSMGQNVKTINHHFESINIADLSSGIYILKINTELGTINKKIVKE